MPNAVDRLSIYNAVVAVRYGGSATDPYRSLWLDLPAPRHEGDAADVVAFVSRETLRQLRDDITALLAQIDAHERVALGSS